jgi:hypothetical protein
MVHHVRPALEEDVQEVTRLLVKARSKLIRLVEGVGHPFL